MSDLYQHSTIATLHRLSTLDVEELDVALTRYVQQKPLALVIPCLYSDLVAKPMQQIMETLRQVPYLKLLVISLDQAEGEHFRLAHEYLSDMPFTVRVLWNHGPRVQSCFDVLADSGLFAGEPGKGRACWIAYGYVLARQDIQTVALHDADIKTYGRELLGRLCYPVVSPHFGYEFCKGFYARYTNRLHGRVTRLLVFPLVRTLRELFDFPPYLNYLSSYRYPLAGEMAMHVDLVRSLRIPADWGLEMGMLGEVYRSVTPKRVCQSELCERYDHKHQALSPTDPDTGLHRMAIDIVKTLFRTMASEGLTVDVGTLKTVVAMYVKRAEDTVNNYAADAAVNDLDFDRHAEETAVNTFAAAIQTAGEDFMEDPLGVPLIPNWNRITSALPGFLDNLWEAVEEDHRSVQGDRTGAGVDAEG